jgi:ribose transport system ATP-binding protein
LSERAENRRTLRNERAATFAEGDTLLHARGICKSFPGVQALDDAEISVRRGTLNALVGENGAGKSTLMNILAGVFPADKGQILLNGRHVNFRNPRDAQNAGISIIFQELNLVSQLTVAENIFLGREPRNRLGLIDYRKMHDDSRRLLAKLDVALDPQTPVARLKVGAQQMVEIAKAISFEVQVIIMDEPTSAISDHEVESLFGLIRQLKQRGLGIIYITHKLDELMHIADDVTVMRDGRFIAARPFREVSHNDFVRMMVGREHAAPFAKTAKPGGDNVLEVRDVSLRHPERPGDYAVRDVSFEVGRGEVLGIFGLMGAGRSELLQTIFGLHPQRSTGTIAVAGKTLRIRSPRDAIRAGIALAPEDRKSEGLVLTMSVAENASLACLDRTTRFGLLQPSRERRLVGEFFDRLAVKAPSLDAPIRNLSGGNQQKVVVSKWLATQPKVLLLDEPTRGVDVNAKRDMYAIIDELAASGLGVVIVSSELPEILTIADRILVLAEGRVTATFSREEANEENLLKAALPQRKTRKTEFA